MASRNALSPGRGAWLLLLLAAALAIGLDLGRHSGQSVVALRTLEPVSADDPEQGGSVDAFCGFAPCGMPLPCAPP